MKIPKSFNILSHEIKVNLVEQIDGDALGECYLTESYVNLAKSYRGIKSTEKNMIDAFYHEKVHLILDAMGYHKLSNNERFVETFSQLLLQSELTAKYEH